LETCDASWVTHESDGVDALTNSEVDWMVVEVFIELEKLILIF
jgi:hypothetical protein